MALSTDVNLPRDHEPVFPDRCLVCSAPNPTSKTRITTTRLFSLRWIFWFLPGGFSVRIPTCIRCGRNLGWRRWVSVAITALIITLTTIYVWPVTKAYIGDSKLAFLGLCVLCLLPQIVWEVSHPHPFDLTALPRSVDYEFADKELAVEFATCNRDAEWVKVEGIDIKPEVDAAVLPFEDDEPA